MKRFFSFFPFLELTTTLVDGFGVEYESQEDITHLPDVLKTIYNIYEDWDGKIYCGINLKWDY